MGDFMKKRLSSANVTMEQDTGGICVHRSTSLAGNSLVCFWQTDSYVRGES